MAIKKYLKIQNINNCLIAQILASAILNIKNNKNGDDIMIVTFIVLGILLGIALA